VDVFIDGQLQTTVDANAAGVLNQGGQVLLSESNLCASQHTLKRSSTVAPTRSWRDCSSISDQCIFQAGRFDGFSSAGRKVSRDRAPPPATAVS
jgi:hypothetical protein